MLKSVVVHDIPTDRVATMERRCGRDPAPQNVRRIGPRLDRHESVVPAGAAADARVHGYFSWRVNEGPWREPPLPGARPMGQDLRGAR
jgi:hypothetical protein